MKCPSHEPPTNREPVAIGGTSEGGHEVGEKGAPNAELG